MNNLESRCELLSDYGEKFKILGIEDFVKFFEYAESVYNKHYGSWKVIENYSKLNEFGDSPFKAIEISTGGWSDNEMIISSMQDCFIWNVFWRASFRGGLHILTYPQ